MTTDRVALVRCAYERYNHRDLDGVLELLDPHVSWPDVVNGTVMVGRDAVRRYWNGHFALASPTVEPEDLYEVGDAVIAIVRQQVNDLNGTPIGPSSVAAHKLTFRDGLVGRMEITVETFPDEVQAVFRPG
jgi:ketosteroid isomerase-like protein